MLTEARVILPGCQALLGFQLIAMLTRTFDELPIDAKLMHAAGLCCVTTATILLIAPTALHRLSFGGNDSEAFLRFGSALVIAALMPLALGIAADVYVVFLKITHSAAVTIAASLAMLLAMLLLWYLYPMWLRAARMTRQWAMDSAASPAGSAARWPGPPARGGWDSGRADRPHRGVAAAPEARQIAVTCTGRYAATTAPAPAGRAPFANRRVGG